MKPKLSQHWITVLRVALIINLLWIGNAFSPPMPQTPQQPPGSQGDLFYYADGERIPLEIAPDYLAVRLFSGVQTLSLIHI